MKPSRFTEEQIIGMLREQEAGALWPMFAASTGSAMQPSTSGRLSTTASRCRTWGLKALEDENAKLKKLLAEAELSQGDDSRRSPQKNGDARRQARGRRSPRTLCRLASDRLTAEAQRRDVDVYGQQYRADPTNIEKDLHYAQALRRTGQRAQAVAVLEKASIESPRDKAVLGAYGRALAEAGNYDQALGSP